MSNLLPREVIAKVVSWINRYSNINDRTITLLCFKCTSRKLNTMITWQPQLNMNRFLEQLLASDIYRIEILDWFNPENMFLYQEIIKYSIKCNNLQRLQYYQCNGCNFNAGLAQYVAQTNRLQCLQYLHQNGCPWDKKTCEAVARGGYLECLRYAQEQRCHWDKQTCQAATNAGHLECLLYAHEQDCPWDEHTCWEAARG